MYTAILVVHVFVSIFLVSVVLLQAGRGADLGAAFGSVGQSTFARGTTTFMSKVTTALAVIFMATSLTLAFMTVERPGQSIIEPLVAEPAPGVDTDPLHNRYGIPYDFKAFSVEWHRPKGSVTDENQVPSWEHPTRDRVGQYCPALAVPRQQDLQFAGVWDMERKGKEYRACFR